MWVFTIEFGLEESIEIKAPMEKIWEQLVDATKWKKWSPWIILEPNSQHSVEWKIWELWYKEQRGGKYIGSGEGILTEIEEGKMLQFTLNFFRPFKSLWNIAEYHIEELWKDHYKITWTLQTSLPVFFFFMKKMMISMIKADFNRGLIMLKDVAETWKLETSTTYLWTEKFDKQYYIAKKWSGSQEEMWVSMWEDFKGLHKMCGEQNIEVQWGFSIYDTSDMTNDYFEYQACLIISEDKYNTLSSSELEEGFYVDMYDETQVAKITHTWDYKYLGNSWTGAFMFLKPEGLKQNKKRSPIEYYEIWPHNSENPAEYKTHIGIPVK